MSCAEKKIGAISRESNPLFLDYDSTLPLNRADMFVWIGQNSVLCIRHVVFHIMIAAVKEETLCLRRQEELLSHHTLKYRA